MFCPDCGSAVAEGRSFCGKCGARLRSAGGVAVAEQPVPVTIPASPMSLRRKLTYALIGMLAVLGGVAWWWFHRPPPPYQVQDPGIYPFQGLSGDGKTIKTGFMDADGKVLIQPQWDAVDTSHFIEGRPVACNEGLCGVMKDGKWGYIDTGGNLVIANQFDSVSPFVEGMARINFGNQVGYIDKTGHLAINPQFYEAGDFHGGLAAVRTDQGWGFINRGGTFVIKPHFQAADPEGFSHGLAGVCIAGRCGYVDRSGDIAIRPQFDSVGLFSDGLARVQINGKLGYINGTGEIVINPQFDQATMFSGGYAAVSVGGRTGTINKQGKYILNPGQYNLAMQEGDALIVQSNQGMGLIAKDGRWILQPSASLTGIGPILGKVFYGDLGGQQSLTPISLSGKVLAGPYQGAMLNALAQDLSNETSALASVRSLVSAEAAYNAAYAAIGFTDKLGVLGPAEGVADQNHANLIDAALATGTKDGYTFTIAIPAGTSSGGTNFNYFLAAKPAAGHYGRTFCADSTGTIRYSLGGQNCTTSSPTL